MVKKFLAAIGSRMDAEEALTQSLVSGKFVAWRLTAISRAHEASTSKWIRIDGAGHIEDTYRKNKRLIVINSHFGIPRIVPHLLSRMGYQIQSITTGNFYGGLDLPERKNISTQQLKNSHFFAKDIFIALKAIKAGKIFHTMADGIHGKAVLELSLLARMRGFSKSYAGLALSNDADVIPVFTHIEPSGQIKVRFCPPLDKGTEEMAGEDRISLMVRQYVSLLSDEYKCDPASVHLNHMNRFLDYPPSENSSDRFDIAARDTDGCQSL